MNKLGALVLTPIGFVVGAAAGSVIAPAFATQGETVGRNRYGNVRKISRQEQDAEKYGALVGALVGATIIAVVAAPSEEKPKSIGVSGPPLQFLGWP